MGSLPNIREGLEVTRIHTLFLLALACSLAHAQISWQPVNNGLGTDTIARAIEVTGNGDLYLGTTEGGYRSTNHGGQWSALVPPGTIEVQSIAHDATHLYAGTSHGMFLSTDAGASWNPINNSFPDDLVLAVAINAAGNVFAGTDLSGLFRSTDFGANWSQLTNGLTSSNLTALEYLGPSTLFAGTDDSGMYVSTNNGDNWKKSDSGLGDLLIRSIAIRFSSNIFVGTNTGGVFRSTNAGQSWVAVNTNLTNPTVVSLCAHPNGDLYAGTVGDGVFRSTDNGATWSATNSGLTNLIVDALAVDSIGQIYAGTAGGGVFRTAQPTGVTPAHGSPLPESYALYQNYPNPFNPGTTIRYALPAAAHVALSIHDILGQTVATLVDEDQAPGMHDVSFDASRLASGTYFYHIHAGNYFSAKKFVLIR